MSKIVPIVFGKDVEYFFNTPFLVRVTAEEASILGNEFSVLSKSIFVSFFERLLVEGFRIRDTKDFFEWAMKVVGWFHLGLEVSWQKKMDDGRIIIILPHSSDSGPIKPWYGIFSSLEMIIKLQTVINSEITTKDEKSRDISFLPSESLQSEFFFVIRHLIENPAVYGDIDKTQGFEDRRREWRSLSLKLLGKPEISKSEIKTMTSILESIFEHIITNIKIKEKIVLIFFDSAWGTWPTFNQEKRKLKQKSVPTIRKYFSRMKDLELLTLDELYESVIPDKSDFRKKWDVLKRQSLFKFVLDKPTLMASFVAARFSEAFKSLQDAKRYAEQAVEIITPSKVKKANSLAVRTAANALNSLLILLYSLEKEMIPPGKWSVGRPATLGSFKKEVSEFFSSFPTLSKALDNLIDIRNKCEHPEALDDVMATPVETSDTIRAIKNVEILYEILRQRIIEEKYLEGPYEDLVRSTI